MANNWIPFVPFLILGEKIFLWSTSQELPSPSWKPVLLGQFHRPCYERQSLLWGQHGLCPSVQPPLLLTFPHAHLDVLLFCKSRHRMLKTNFSTNLCWWNGAIWLPNEAFQKLLFHAIYLWGHPSQHAPYIIAVCAEILHIWVQR